MYFQGGPGSHVAALTDKGTVVEAITTGVTERLASVYFDGKHYVVIKRPDWSVENGRMMIRSMRSKIGIGYGWHQVIAVGISIFFGNHWDWQPRISGDVFVSLAMLAFATYRFNALFWTIVALAGLYASVLVVTRSKPHIAPYEQTITGRWPQTHL